MNSRWIESVDFGRGWSVIAVLLPAVAYSAVLDAFWAVAAVAALALLFLPKFSHLRPLPFALSLALLGSFQPFALARLLGVDSQTVTLVGIFLQVWFIYFFSLACMVLVRDRFWPRLLPRFSVFLAVMISISLSSLIGILAFLADRIFSTSLLPSNAFLMVQLTIAFFGSILLGVATLWYIGRVEHFSGQMSARRPVED